MRHSFILSLFFMAFLLVSYSAMATEDDIFTEYTNFKNDIQNKLDIDYSLDMSFMWQGSSSKKSKSAYQTIYSPSITWNAFKSDKYGSGSVDFVYTRTQYWSAFNGDDLSSAVNVANSVNDYGDNESNFDQLSYTHTLPSGALSLTLGQYPIYLFDGGTYNSNQMSNFINYALSQNATSSYPTASLGAYLQYSPNSEFTLAAGFQDANNIDGTRINFHTFGNGKYTGFGYIAWNPEIKGLGAGEYSLLYYNQPSVDTQVGNSQGWSFNATQNLSEKLAIFARFNNVSGDVESIKTSVVFGGVYNNPFNRNSLDQIGLAVALNRINRSVATPNYGTKTGKNETVIEGYYAFGISDYITITPDVQFYINPALDTNKDTATVFSLRLSFML